MRRAEIRRETKETKVSGGLFIDGSGKIEIDTGIGFFDHMLILFGAHGKFDLDITCNGDTYVDYHHSVEDIGISLGKAFREAAGENYGIKRYGQMLLPMDETLVMVSVDVSGRPYLVFDVEFLTEKTGEFDNELIEEFFRAFVMNSGITLHIKLIHGRNSHHIAEAIFKGTGRALREAYSIDIESDGRIPSTKGVL